MTQIFVGNLAFATSETALRSAFEPYGRVSSVRLATDRQTGKPRGFAFVTMSRFEDADEAITRLHGAQFQGRSLVVNEARASEARPTLPVPASRWHLI
ncbi:MAG: RNA-binding protein [Planctomycetaceae bacterium]|nr:RNA-binding protein [Planctomycetaceae bacterium]